MIELAWNIFFVPWEAGTQHSNEHLLSLALEYIDAIADSRVNYGLISRYGLAVCDRICLEYFFVQWEAGTQHSNEHLLSLALEYIEGKMRPD